ncbi:hypothetical protein CROQUDRAFT_308196 [Cronartium quercuum f. sp. fusiforme G11]|uniref:DUF6534 domain-containing protein n=1 Tax=Cronartium quercuum f. sp. fusiforme G11 TaxID=708437 RepID=A0A9P6N854_9BASI|nr:hypothetical protein CROQUDRAFT_308196 [Cronartium quercuum f. sp. fusiforme G11]
MLLHQCYTYFVTFQEDRRIFKYAVLFLLMLNIVHTALCQLTVWHLAVRHLLHESEWRQPRWLFAFYPPLCGIASCLVQIFYAHRIYLFSQRNLVISGLVTFGSLFQFTWSMLAAVRIFTVKEISNFRFWKYGVACWLGTAAATDFLVTSSMLWLLLKARGKIQKTNTIIDQLIALTVGTNILTFTVGLSDLMLFCFDDRTSTHVSTNLCLLKLYSSSLLFWLNARPRLLEKFGGGILIEDCELITNNQNETCEQGEIGSFDEELHNQEPGIRVVTTASLRADQVPLKDIFSGPRTLDSNKTLGNLSKGWRADDQNGFTIQIIGGRNLLLKKGT